MEMQFTHICREAVLKSSSKLLPMTTMREVAQRAGVSATTVSFVLNGRQPAGGPISEETQQRVLDAAKALGYRPNSLAKAMAAGHNRTIGFLARHLWHEFTARILSGALEEARLAGYGLQVLQLKSNLIDRQAIDTCLEMRVAGLLTVDMDPEALEYLHTEMRPYNIPIAFLDTSFRQEWGIHVATDDVQGCHLVIEHLAQLGHQRIAFIGGEMGRGMAVSRVQAYRDAMKKHGLKVPKDYVVSASWSHELAVEAASNMLQLKSPPTAIFCASDEMAVGAQIAARRLGLQMPRDLSVIGFSNLVVSTLADPLLTTVNQPMTEIGEVATKLLLENMKKVGDGNALNDSPIEVLLPTSLVVRSSTAKPAHH